jgi:hypothetical protein
VAAGIGPLASDGARGERAEPIVVEAGEPRPVEPPRDAALGDPPSPATDGGRPEPPGEQRATDTGEASPATAPVAPEAPPVQQEFGVEAAAAPAPSAPASASGGGGSGSTAAAVQQEFGP